LELSLNLTKLQQNFETSSSHCQLITFELNNKKNAVLKKTIYAKELETELNSVLAQKLIVSVNLEKTRTDLIQQSNELSRLKKDIEKKQNQSAADSTFAESLRSELAVKSKQLEKCQVQSVTNSSKQNREYIALQLQILSANKSCDELSFALQKSETNFAQLKAALTNSQTAYQMPKMFLKQSL